MREKSYSLIRRFDSPSHHMAISKQDRHTNIECLKSEQDLVDDVERGRCSVKKSFSRIIGCFDPHI